jgi:hypothetical protein
MINEYNIEWLLQSLLYLLVIVFLGAGCIDMNENLKSINEIIPSNSILHIDEVEND